MSQDQSAEYGFQINDFLKITKKITSLFSLFRRFNNVLQQLRLYSAGYHYLFIYSMRVKDYMMLDKVDFCILKQFFLPIKSAFKGHNLQSGTTIMPRGVSLQDNQGKFSSIASKYEIYSHRKIVFWRCLKDSKSNFD